MRLARDVNKKDFSRKDIARLKAKIAIRQSGCWEYVGSVDKIDGYGNFYINGRKFRTHRVMFAYYKRDIPAKKIICHKCDNRRCCNPDHLFIGTSNDNYLDALKKGRIKIKLKSKKAWAVRRIVAVAREISEKKLRGSIYDDLRAAIVEYDRYTGNI